MVHPGAAPLHANTVVIIIGIMSAVRSSISVHRPPCTLRVGRSGHARAPSCHADASHRDIAPCLPRRLVLLSGSALVSGFMSTSILPAHAEGEGTLGSVIMRTVALLRIPPSRHPRPLPYRVQGVLWTSIPTHELWRLWWQCKGGCQVRQGGRVAQGAYHFRTVRGWT